MERFDANRLNVRFDEIWFTPIDIVNISSMLTHSFSINSNKSSIKELLTSYKYIWYRDHGISRFYICFFMAWGKSGRQLCQFRTTFLFINLFIDLITVQHNLQIANFCQYSPPSYKTQRTSKCLILVSWCTGNRFTVFLTYCIVLFLI